MSMILVCSTDVAPCPVEDQVWVTFDVAFSPDALGIDAATVTYVLGWGCGVILFMWLLGYGAKLAIDVINKV